MELREYQKDLLQKGIDILSKKNIVYYALEMRLGKTFISLFTADHFKPTKVLFITKKKAIDNIVRDFEKTGFTWELICINYESIHKVSDVNAEIIIFDEAHRLGGFPSCGLATKRAKEITKNKKVIFLSGTPTPESESQLYHQFYVSKYSPFYESNFYRWAHNYVNIYEEIFKYKDKKTGELVKRIIKKYDKAKKDLIFESVGDYFVRYSQENAGFQKKIEERFLYVDMNEMQKTLCSSLKALKVYNSADHWVVKAETGASMQSKFHQIHSGSVILHEDDETKPKKFKIINTAKAYLIKEYFKDKKIAIFYKFQAELEIIKSVFNNITNDQFEFNNSDDLVFVGQVTSCREGINLSTADHLVFYNISFSALDYWQSINRFQAQERTKDCVIYWIFTKNGIENKIYDVVINKKDYTLQYFKKDFMLKTMPELF